MLRYHRLRMVTGITLVCLLILTVGAVPLFADPSAELIITGYGKLETTADQAVLRLVTHASGVTEQAAQDANTKAVNRLVAALEVLGIEQQAIQEEPIDLWCVSGENSWSGFDANGEYRASQVVRIEVENFKLIQPVIDAAIQAGANQIKDIEFGKKQCRQVREDVVQAALQDARQKAKMIANMLHVKLGPVLEIKEGEISSPVEYVSYNDMLAEEDCLAEPPKLEAMGLVEIRFAIEANTP